MVTAGQSHRPQIRLGIIQLIQGVLGLALDRFARREGAAHLGQYSGSQVADGGIAIEPREYREITKSIGNLQGLGHVVEKG